MLDDKDRGKVLDPTGPLPEKRKYCYCQHPLAYEISLCPKCGGHNITWSEYENYIWCIDCQIDYIPEHFGIFDGPIPVELAEEFGTKFDRIELDTGKRIKRTDLEYNNTWKD